MAETRGDHTVRGWLNVSGNAKFNGGLDSPYLEVVDKKSYWINGGTFSKVKATVEGWRTRDLNVTNYDDFSSDITLSTSAGGGGDITLDKGVYYCEISCPAAGVDSHTARLADVTESSPGEEVLAGSAEYAFYAEAAQSRSFVSGEFQLRSEKTLEVQHQCRTTQETYGFGRAGGFYPTDNVYTIVKMWLVRDDS